MAKVLGLSFYFHDSAAALVVDGRVVAAAAEERFTRRKHTHEFPARAVEFCLEQGGLQSVNDLDAIVFYEKPLRKMLRVVEGMVATWPRSLPAFTRKLPDYLKGKVNLVSVIARALPGYDGRILFSEHHLSHAASAYYCSPFDEAAILTIDGVGESETTTIGVGRGQDIQILQSLHFPHSVGLLYSALTAYLGFRVNDAEWKVMGLAPYGRPTYVDQFQQLVDRRNDGSFALNLSYFAHHYSTQHSANLQAWQTLFGFPMRQPEEPLDQRHHDLARSGQAVVEQMVVALAAEAKRVSGSANLVIAGGVGLNSVANWRVEESGLFEQVWIQPAAGDDGGALGAALVVSQQLFKDPRTPALQDVYLGPDLDDDEVALFVEREGIPSRRLGDDALIAEVAGRLDDGLVIGWARGRMEFGPRSLGARSILASPRSAEMKAIVNTKVKYREFFRPFAPSIPLEHVHEYFDVPPGTPLPFMLKIPKVRESMRERIPAVTHEDGTGRVQTVEAATNPVFHRLLRTMGARTGVPVLLNTSFNVRGEPVVCGIDDVYQCFVRTGIDALVLGNHLIEHKQGDALTPEQGYAISNALERGAAETTSTVLRFYRGLPFNAYSGAVDAARELMAGNRVKAYPVLHKHLKRTAGLRLLDVGCGAGWFVNSCAHFYRHAVTGLEINPVALRQARAVTRMLPDHSRVHFEQANLFEYTPSDAFDVVNSLGVLHHTPDCVGAIRRVAGWVTPGGYLHLGLYHHYGRKPFLDHFARLRDAGATEAQLFETFKALAGDITDETHLESWFRDQVLHPHETQHTFEEIGALVQALGFEIEAVSLNGDKRRPDMANLVAFEKTMTRRSERALAKGRYFPGFFVIWARRAHSGGT